LGCGLADKVDGLRVARLGLAARAAAVEGLGLGVAVVDGFVGLDGLSSALKTAVRMWAISPRNSCATLGGWVEANSSTTHRWSGSSSGPRCRPAFW
jgi:hypothetical protein